VISLSNRRRRRISLLHFLNLFSLFTLNIHTTLSAGMQSAALHAATSDRGKLEKMSGVEDFQFPFEPYAVQVELMNSVYSALNEGQVGIFESPTGTGKSMSLICASLRWLKENPVYVPATTGDTRAEDEDLPAWVVSHAKKKEEEAREAAVRAEKERLERARMKMAEDAVAREKERDKAERDRAKIARPTVLNLAGKSRDKDDSGKAGKVSKEERDRERETDKLVLSDDEDNKPRDRTADEVLKKLFGDSSEAETRKETEDELPDVRKIIYCSRTHSQLSQFMREVKRTTWARDLKAVALASRKRYAVYLLY
jgi:chromosome transmission fidelity protein 1